MAKFKDIEKIAKQNNISLMNMGKRESTLFRISKIVAFSQDWIDYIDVDDNVIEILIKIGEGIFEPEKGDMLLRHAVEWAIRQGSNLNLNLSSKKIRDIFEKFEDDDVEIDFSSVSDGPVPMSKVRTLKSIIGLHGTPVTVRMPHYFGDFYYVAERKRGNMIYGMQYKNGREYKKRSYSINELCYLYSDGCQGTIKINEKDSQQDKDRKYNNQIRDRIKKKDSFDEVDANSNELLNHQKAGVLLAQRYDKFAFFYDTGTGKTVMALSIIKDKQDKKDAKFLIIAPKAIIKTAWMEDASNFFPGLRIFPLSNNFYFTECRALYDRWKKYSNIPVGEEITEEEWSEVYKELDYDSPSYIEDYKHKYELMHSIWEHMIDLADHYIVNIEKFRYDPYAIMEEFDIDGVIVDESAVLKNPDSVNAKTLSEWSDEFDYIYLLSGKPAPNNSTEYYAQMKLVDPDTFDMSFNNFKQMYFSGAKSKIMPKSAKAEDDVANMVALRSLIVSKDDCLSLPDIYREIRTFELPKKIKEQYNRLFKFCIFELQASEKNKTGAFYSAVCKLAIFTKLREIASGFLIDEYGSTKELHDCKIKELLKIVEEHKDDQIIIWCQFEYEICKVFDALKKYGTVVTAYGNTKNIDESISMFKKGEAKYIVAHPKSIKYGVTFVKCNTAVYYSMSYSAEDYYQSRDRIHRLGQMRMCTYYFIQGKDTIDEVMFQAVERKMSYAEIFSVIVKQAAKHGINYQEFKANEEIVNDESVSTKLVNDEYRFEIVDDVRFSYKYNRQIRESILFNTLLKDEGVFRPEQILFEVGFAIRLDEKEKKAEKVKKEVLITYNDVIDVAKWVLTEFDRIKIKKIQKVYNYLEELIQNQYECDVANGAAPISDLNELALKKARRKKNADSNESEKAKKKFNFGEMGRAKKEYVSLVQVRNELNEIFFASGKYRLTHDCFCGDKSVAHCHPNLGLIYQKKSEYMNPTPETLFDLLHEIGHLENNTEDMTRQEDEHYATEWAIQRMKLYDFKLPKNRQKEFEEYIKGFSSRKNILLPKDKAAKLDWDE